MNRSTSEKVRIRMDRARDIEAAHFDGCLWQAILPGRTIMVECMNYPEGDGTAIVVTHFDKPLPKPASPKPWPEVNAFYVYALVDDTNTWNGLDAALYEGERRAKARRDGAKVDPVVEKLKDRRNELMNAFGHGSFHDGLTQAKIDAISLTIADLEVDDIVSLTIAAFAGKSDATE